MSLRQNVKIIGLYTAHGLQISPYYGTQTRKFYRFTISPFYRVLLTSVCPCTLTNEIIVCHRTIEAKFRGPRTSDLKVESYAISAACRTWRFTTKPT